MESCATPILGQTLEGTHPLAERVERRRGKLIAIEVHIVRVHVAEAIRMDRHADRIGPDRSRPLIMNVCQFYGLGEMVHPSTLAQIPESAYRPQSVAVVRG